MATSVEQQLSICLTDVHAIELQALEQVKRARRVAGDPELQEAFADHTRETERHRTYVEDRLMARSWAPVPQKDISGKVSGVGMALFARFHPTPPASSRHSRTRMSGWRWPRTTCWRGWPSGPATAKPF